MPTLDQADSILKIAKELMVAAMEKNQIIIEPDLGGDKGENIANALGNNFKIIVTKVKEALSEAGA